MVYHTDAAKWKAYQFLDPFAAGSFYVCNKLTKYFCRPDCDAHTITELRSEIKFVPSVATAVESGYVPCDACDPMLLPLIDVGLLVQTVRDINAVIGFVPPLLDDDEDSNTETIRENMLDSVNQRRLSVPVVAVGKNSRLENTNPLVSKIDSEHYRLVDMACRHLALAAAASIFNPVLSSANSPKSEDSASPGSGKRKRKRRGGVLGFKELAAKSKLSAWHFHRVFKSVTRLTPKTYGDKCWEYLREKSLEPKSTVSASSSRSSSANAGDRPCLTPSSSFHLPGSPRKRVREPDEEPSPKRYTPMSHRPQTRAYTDATYGFDESEFGPSLDFGASRATSVPDLTILGGRPSTLFGHLKPVDFFPSNDHSSLGMETVPENMDVVPDFHVEMSHEMMHPNFFAGASGFSANMFPMGDELMSQPDLAVTEALALGLLPELLMNPGL